MQNITQTQSLTIYLKEISEVPLLKREEEISLAKRIARGDKKARTHMIRANLRLVVAIAKHYMHVGMPIEDLISEGNIGLMHAVDRFDPNRGVRFSTYGSWWIRQAVKRALANQSKTIRLPVHMVEKIFKMNRASRELFDLLGRDPTSGEIAEALGLSEKKIRHLKSVSQTTTSLDTPVGDTDSTSLESMLPDETTPNPSEIFTEKASRLDLIDTIKQLNEREQAILISRFGLNGGQPQTLSCLGRRFKVTRERIRQLQTVALNKMKKMLRSQDETPSRADISWSAMA